MRRFNDPDDRNRPPEDLTAWLAAGLRRVEAQEWRRWNFTLAEATRWRSAGVGEALTAAQWQVAGADPDTVGDWLAARISVGEAIRWHEFGFTFEQARDQTRNGRTPDDVYGRGMTARKGTSPYTAVTHRVSAALLARHGAYRDAGVPTTVAAGYIETQWTDEEAIPWGKQAIDARDALVWLRIGLTPPEAGELTRAGRRPADVVRDWWSAGIPFDEVADWLGAGLTADEAVAQREAGVTVEQAAAMRALRRGGTA